jgi:hypothetical protein
MSNINIESLKNIINNHFEELYKLEKLTKSENNDDKTFYIYTTGIANAGSDQVIDIWEQCRYTNIIKQIPDYFNLIIIEHYDSISNKKINTVINKQDTESLNRTKKTQQTFINKNFNFSDFETTNKHYIILDFAHILHYCYDKTKPYNNYYMVDDKNKEFNTVFNCIYIDFPDHNCDSYKENIQYFQYDYNNKKFTSYIELFLKKCNQLYSEKIVQVDGIYNIEQKLIDVLLKPPINILLKTITDSKERQKLFNISDNLNKLNDLYKEFFNKLFNSDINLLEIKNYKILKTPEYNEYGNIYK